jgi:hypothetical protein
LWHTFVGFCRKLEPERPPPPVAVKLYVGRLRKTYYWVLSLLAMYGGWIWFGSSGVALVGLWSYVHYPHMIPSHLLVDLAELRSARLELQRICLRYPRWRVVEVFRDEVSVEQWAALRRAPIAYFSRPRSRRELIILVERCSSHPR